MLRVDIPFTCSFLCAYIPFVCVCMFFRVHHSMCNSLHVYLMVLTSMSNLPLSVCITPLCSILSVLYISLFHL